MTLNLAMELLLFAGPLCAAGILLTLVWSNWRWGIVPMPTSPRVRRVCVYLLGQALRTEGRPSRGGELSIFGDGTNGQGTFGREVTVPRGHERGAGERRDLEAEWHERVVHKPQRAIRDGDPVRGPCVASASGVSGAPSTLRVAELGAGFGTLARGIGRALPEAQVEAFEGNGPVYVVGLMLDKLARLLRRRPVPRVNYRRADFMAEPLSEYDAVVCYLYPGAMMPLARKLSTTMRDGTWVVSNAFALPGWKPVQVVRAKDWYRSRVYLYRVPESLE